MSADGVTTPGSFYALRYRPEVKIDQRKHAHTLGRWPTWADADDARERTPVSGLLEVVGPRFARGQR
jgi:hypothetical protein